MSIEQLLHDLLFDYTLRTVALGAGVLGLVSGALGSFAVLRQQSLLGDTVSHAALPGIALAFLVTGSKAPLVLVLGAALAGWLGTLLVMAMVRTTRLKSDTAFGIVLSVFFGFGLVLLTFIQKQPNSRQAGLEKFLFGQATALLQRDVVTMAAVGAVLILLVILLFKEFKLLSFDHDYGVSLGFPMRRLDFLLTSGLVVAVVLGLQTVGVVLMSAMIVAPAAAARQWTDRLGVMIVLAARLGALAGVGGAVLSSLSRHLPTGPVIVLCASGLVAISMLFAPRRGLIWNWSRRYRNRRRLTLDAVLLDLHELAVQHADREHGHPASTLRAMSAGPRGIRRSLKVLSDQGYVRETASGSGVWGLTPDGWNEAERLATTLGPKS